MYLYCVISSAVLRKAKKKYLLNFQVIKAFLCTAIPRDHPAQITATILELKTLHGNHFYYSTRAGVCKTLCPQLPDSNTA